MNLAKKNSRYAPIVMACIWITKGDRVLRISSFEHREKKRKKSDQMKFNSEMEMLRLLPKPLTYGIHSFD